MNIVELQKSLDAEKISIKMHELMTELYPICRSITGNGVRETLNILKRVIPLTIHEVPSGTEVFDWTVPKEWNIKDAFVKNSKGNKIIDFTKSNLHVLSYSIPIHKRVSLRELKEHLFTNPEYPEWIPYRTSYYDENWGFCISHNQFEKLEDDVYEVCIDSSLMEGHLTYGEFFIKGKASEEVLISTHVCHPSLCNDNLSGLVLTAFLAHHLARTQIRYSYRFLFIPGTIGSITWLSRNESNVSKIKNGLVVACVGDSGRFTYKKTRQGDAEIDKVVTHVLKHSEVEYEILNFTPYGYDERQFCSPGFNLPVGCLSRTQHGQFPEYHSSADNLDFVQPENLALSLSKYMEVIDVLDNNRKYLNQNPKCEPQLGKRGLYEAIGGHNNNEAFQLAMLWVLNLADGDHTLLDISEHAEMDFGVIHKAASSLLQNGLIQELNGDLRPT